MYSRHSSTRMTSIGGLVILLEWMRDKKYIHSDDSDLFLDDLFAIEGVKEVNGPLVNGIYAIIVEIDPEGPIDKQANDLRQAIEEVWNKHAK